jgi:DNA-binding response OmpR family regulator
MEGGFSMGVRIMIVEDNADLHLGLALRLKSEGHTVLSAMNGDEAIPLALNERPALILLDIGLPGRDGHLVAGALAANNSTRSIPIIYLTARDEISHRLKAAQDGAAAYLVKPCTAARLFSAIDSAIHPPKELHSN